MTISCDMCGAHELVNVMTVHFVSGGLVLLVTLEAQNWKEIWIASDIVCIYD